MTLQDYLNLQNGTDIRGVASKVEEKKDTEQEGAENVVENAETPENTPAVAEVVENAPAAEPAIDSEPITLTTEAATAIAKAFCFWLRNRVKKKKIWIAVGYDSRTSSPALCEAVVQGILSMGSSVVVTGLSTTPSMFMYLKDKEAEKACHGSIMITASHLPANRNGLKFFHAEGGLNKEDVTEILTVAAEQTFKKKHAGKRLEISYIDRYAQSLVSKVREATGEETPLRGKKIIVDAGNGAGGFFADKVLTPLGADTIGSRFLDPDGTFPNHIPNPENAEAMQSICEAVKVAEADLGIIFDTDVDRAGAVDKNGEEINRNRLIALISAILLEEEPGTIVTDSVTSDGLTKFIEEKGGRHHRFKRGYKNVINEAIRLNAEGEYTPLAIETSGHAAFLENYFLDDGAYLITRLLIAMAKIAKQGRSLSDLIEDLEMPVEAVELRIPFVEGCDYATLGQQLIIDFTLHANDLSYASVPAENYEGCRISYSSAYASGWALLRMSLHEPILPINMESAEKHGILKIARDLYYFLRKYPYIDISSLEETVEKCRAALLEEVKQATAEKRLNFLF